MLSTEEVKANLAAITLYKGMELDFKGSFDWINSHVDLSIALGKEKNKLFRCLHKEHLDKRPSASIFKLDGYMYYRCSCGHFHKPKSVIDTLAHILNMDKVEIQYLIVEALGITLGSEYQKKCRMLIVETKANLMNMIEEGTLLYKEMKPLWGALNVIHDFALKKVTIAPLSKNSNRPTFFMNRTQLQAEMLRLGIKGASNAKAKLDQLKDLGFIRPLKDEELIKSVLAEANKEKDRQAILIGKNYINRVEYYELCAITPAMIKKAEENIKLRISLGAKKKNMNVTRRLNVYGSEHTQSVNVQGKVTIKEFFNKNEKKYVV